MKFSDRLKRLLIEKDMTQRELGRLLQVTEGAVSNYINQERQPSLQVLQAMADIFGVTVDYLIGRTDDPKGFTDAPLPPDWEQTIRSLRAEGLSARDVEAAIELIKAAKKMREG